VTGDGRWNVLVVSASTFGVVLSVLTAVRVWYGDPPATVESHAIEGLALLMVVMAACAVYRGGDRLDSVILAFGPAFAFALNWLGFGWSTRSLWILGLAGLGAGFFAIVPAALGYLLGYTVRERSR
jgi:hypothetical protein